MTPLLLPSTWFGWTLLIGVWAVLVIVAVVVLCMPAAGRADRDAARDAAALDDSPLPVLPRAWLVEDARVRHDVLFLGTVVDANPTHAPYPGQVLVKFDALSEPRWTRVRECDPVTPEDERSLLDLLDRGALFLNFPNVDPGARTRYPAQCRLVPGDSCYWHGATCGRTNPWEREPQFCCPSCPARGGAA